MIYRSGVAGLSPKKPEVDLEGLSRFETEYHSAEDWFGEETQAGELSYYVVRSKANVRVWKDLQEGSGNGDLSKVPSFGQDGEITPRRATKEAIAVPGNSKEKPPPPIKNYVVNLGTRPMHT